MKRTMITALLAGLLLSSCKAESKSPVRAAAPAPVATPALWKLADKDTVIYLFGTVHVLPETFKWQSAKLNAAIVQSDELVVEVADLDDTVKTAGIFMRLAQSPNLPPVSARLPAEKLPGFVKLAVKAGVPIHTLDRFESWAVALTLASGMLKELDVSPDNGADSQLTTLFKAAKKPISGLETTEQQLGFFDQLSEPAQRTFLGAMIDESTDPKAEFETMIAAWSRGDEKRIALSFDDELQMTPELLEKLLRARNANWTTLIAKRMEKPGTVFIAVGAGHLAGKDSVQTMLKKRGLKAKRIQ